MSPTRNYINAFKNIIYKSNISKKTSHKKSALNFLCKVSSPYLAYITKRFSLGMLIMYLDYSLYLFNYSKNSMNFVLCQQKGFYLIGTAIRPDIIIIIAGIDIMTFIPKAAATTPMATAAAANPTYNAM